MIRFTLIGDSCVGKSTLINILNGRSEASTVTTIGVNFSIYIDNKRKIKYMIIDTSGMSRMLSITGGLIKSYQNTVIVYQNNIQKNRWTNFLNSIKYDGTINYLKVDDKIKREDIENLKKIMSSMEECVKETKTN